MEKKSLAAVLEEPGKIILKEFPLPEVGPDDGLLKVEMVGICSTDVKIYQGKITTYPLPLIMGHEMVGVIARIGHRAARKWKVKEGDRVVLEASTSCGACEPCLTGNYRFCEQPLGYGLKTSCNVPPHLWGAYSEYMYIAPGSVVFPVTDALAAEEAVLITGVLANSVQWLCFLGGLKMGDTVLIQGMGVQGLGAIVAAKAAGASEVIIAGLSVDRERFPLAEKLGATAIVDVEKEDLLSFIKERTRGRGIDLVLDVTGSPPSIALALEVVRKQGTIIEAGLIGGDREVPFILDRLAQKEIRIQGARSKGYAATKAAISLVESKRYPVGEMVTHLYPLKDCQEALTVAQGKEGVRPIKVAMIP